MPLIAVQRAMPEERALLQSLYHEYLIELARFDPEVKTNQPLSDDWWVRPEDLHPLLIRQSGQVVGFLLVLGRLYTKAIGHESDYHLYDFYVVPEARGSGAASRAFEWVCQDLRGSWGLDVLHNNPRAVRFWEKYLKRRAPEKRSDHEGKSAYYLFRT